MTTSANLHNPTIIRSLRAESTSWLTFYDEHHNSIAIFGLDPDLADFYEYLHKRQGNTTEILCAIAKQISLIGVSDSAEEARERLMKLREVFVGIADDLLAQINAVEQEENSEHWDEPQDITLSEYDPD